MSTKIKGITIELSADASGIENALKSVNKELRSTQSQLNSVNKSLKLDPGNTELIEQKQRLLGKSIDETKKKLEALKTAQASIDTGSGNGQAQYDALTREISDTTVKLNKLTEEQTRFDSELSNAQSKTSAYQSALTKVGNTAAAVAEKTSALSAAAGAALMGLAAIGLKGAQQADDWATLAQQIGVSTESIQKFEYASAGIDVNVNDITGAITKMKGHLTDTSGIWQQLGVQVKNQRGDYRAIEDIFNDTVRALGNIDNETQRDIMSMKIFGKSAGDLAGLIDDGGKKFRALSQEAENLGLIMSDEDVQKLADVNEQLDIMKVQIKAALVNLALPIMQALAPIINVVADAVKSLASILSRVNPTLMTVIVTVLLIVAAISPVAGIIANITSALMGLPATLAAVASAASAAAAALAPMLPYIVAFVAIAGAIALVGYAIYSLVQRWQELRSESSSAMGVVVNVVKNGENQLLTFAGTVVGAFNPIGGAILSIAGGFTACIPIIKGVFNQISAIFTQFINKARSFGSKILKAFADGITSTIQQVINAVQKLVSAMSNLWSSAERQASQAGSRTANAYVNSYNSTSSTARLNNPVSSNYLSAGRSASTSNYLSSSSEPGLVNAMNSLSASLDRYSAQTTNVNVELVGSAKNIFDTVRVQNNMLQTATGYHALA